VTAPATALRAIVLADGDAPRRADLDVAWPGWADGVGLVVAADGGARHASALGLRLDAWAGDGDSIGPRRLAALERAGVVLHRAPVETDESDTELAVQVAIRAGAGDVTILGAFGGQRLDHALANVALLAHPALAGIGARLLDARTRASLIRGPGRATVTGRVGDVISLLALDGRVDGITTQGLRFPLSGEPLQLGRPRGLSNVRTAPEATVIVDRGLLLVVESPATFAP
jgi:thiamine pyrophosphokinase